MNEDAGPDAPEEIYYANVATVDGQTVNLRVTTDDAYSCIGCGNVRDGMLGQVNMKGSSNRQITVSGL